jgi:hypothetical protein
MYSPPRGLDWEAGAVGTQACAAVIAPVFQ